MNPSQEPMKFTKLVLLVVALATPPADVRADESEWQISIDPDTVVREVDLAKLLGSNAGLWYQPQSIERLVNSDYVPAWGPGLIRIPGGSWSDEIYWNGNGVRDGKTFDQSKFGDGLWRVDYSD